MTTKITFLDTNQFYQSQQLTLEESPSASLLKGTNFLIKNEADSILNSSDQEKKLLETSIITQETLSITSAQIASQLGLSDKISITFPNGVVYEGEWKNNMPDVHGKMTFLDDGSYEGTWGNGQMHGYGIYITGSLKYSGNFFEGKFHGKGELIGSNGNKYIGDFSEDKYHGKGELTHANGVKYVGDFFKDEFHGKGELIYADGAKYVGIFSEGKRHGKGEFIYADGTKYVGDFSKSKFHGKGEVIYADGSKYVGIFFEGKFHGKGEHTHANGENYAGDFSEGNRHGKGELTHADGEKYVGDFFKGEFHGKGELIYANGSKYAGDFSEDKFHGKGELTHADGEKYVGDFFKGEFHGKGEFIYANGTKYVGDFSEDKRHGKGEFIYANGEKYVGDFSEGKRHGKGEFIYANGSKYAGDFSEDKFHGKGEYTHANGEKYEGNFDQGNLHGTITYTDQHGTLHRQIYRVGQCTYSKPCTSAQIRAYKDQKEEERKSILATTTNQPVEKSIDKLTTSIKGSHANKKSRKKKTGNPIPTENESSESIVHLDAPEIPEETSLETDNTASSLSGKIDENKDVSDIKEKISRLLSEGKHHLPKPHSRVSRWRHGDVLNQMEDFQDGVEHKYHGMSLAKKQEMLLFHEAGSSLDPIIFHPDMKELYTYQTNTGIGCYAEIIRGGHTYQGVILFGINDNSICYHRMFEPRNNIDFLTLTMHQFFDVKPENNSSFLTPDDVFYAQETENQLLYSNNLYELDDKTGIFSLHDTRENIQATIRILPLDAVTRRLARRSIDPNLFFMHHSSLHNMADTPQF